ncbi:MAG: alpha/beta fold hydrolase, partial [Myxococcota bacterium]|nr:alpha/beta fold hydrolase [Myxococcota bacterium]
GFFTDQAEGALNGVLGDYLHGRGNQLGFQMGLREGGDPLPVETDAIAAAHPQAGKRVCIFVHGLAATEWSWKLFATEYYGDRDVDFATQLERDLGTTSFFVRFNSGRHVSENGRELSCLVDRLVQQYPHPIEDLTLIGHSMGGLVVRSAAHHARVHGAGWLDRLDRIVCIGSPHMGAPLEQAVNVLSSVLGFFDLPGTQVPAEILNARSVGIKDLRFGYTVDEEWMGRDPDALWENNRLQVEFVDHVAYYFVAGHVTADVEHPGAWMLGDLLVRLPSAGGVSKSRRMPFRFGKVFPNMTHLHLLNHPDVYALVKQLCQGEFDRGGGE